MHSSGTVLDCAAGPFGSKRGVVNSATPINGKAVKVGATTSRASAEYKRPRRSRMFCSTLTRLAA